MDPVTQGSFIPKQSLVATRGRGGLGIFLFLSILMFVMSILAAGGAYLYEQFVTRRIAGLDEQLKLAEGAFNTATIQDLARTDSRLIEAEKLLERHVAPSSAFSFISTITLEKVQFNSMAFNLMQDGSATIAMGGTADSFSTVALQSDKFGQSKLLKDVIFSGITVGDDGKVDFSVNATIDPSVISYKATIAPSASAATETP